MAKTVARGCEISSVLHVVTDAHPWQDELRTLRLSLFLRLINSPCQCLQDKAFGQEKLMNSHWYQEACEDLALVASGVALHVGTGRYGVSLYSTGWWSDICASIETAA